MKVPIFCSLLPTELIISLGYEPHYISADELLARRPQEYHSAFHENLCSYVKSLYDYLVRNEAIFEVIIIPAGCDALKKLYNALSDVLPSDKLYLLDVPQIKGEYAGKYLSRVFERLAVRLGSNASHRLADSACVDEYLKKADAASESGSAVKIGIIGSNVPLGTLEASLAKFGFESVFLNHCLTKSYPEKELFVALERGLEDYARLFMEKNSCPRTDDYTYRERLARQVLEEGIGGLVIESLKFCDFQPFEYKYFKEALGDDFPVVLIENELTASSEGQIMTRLEAFFENIREKVLPSRKEKRRSGNFFVGIDSGSHATKLVCIDRDSSIISRLVVSTGTSVKKSAETLLKRLEDEHGIRRMDISKVVATGYGRSKVTVADDTITEITCHAIGAHHILGEAATIIDIGGQDSKAIKIDKNGAVIRFSMNDKCAAGTGRFLEVMASKLEMTLEEFAQLAYNSDKLVSISSMCSVFAESEVISLIAAGKSKEEIAKGIHRAIAERTIALARRVDGEPPYYMTGGVAKNKGLVRELEGCVGGPVAILDQPQFSGALGAAIIAQRMV